MIWQRLTDGVWRSEKIGEWHGIVRASWGKYVPEIHTGTGRIHIGHIGTPRASREDAQGVAETMMRARQQ